MEWLRPLFMLRRCLAGSTLTIALVQFCCSLPVSGSTAEDSIGVVSISQLAIINITYIDPATGELRSERSDFGMFGSESRLDQEWGLVVHARSSDNHTDGCSPPVNAPAERWIALIERGACKFHQKIHNAAIISNASAVVIYNHEHETELLTMKHKVDDVVSVFISRTSGERIVGLVDNGTRVVMHIGVGPIRTQANGSVNRTSVLFVSISFIVLMVISLAWLIFYYVQRFRYAHTKDRLAKRLIGAAKKAVNKMPVKTIRRGDVEAEPDYDLCAICVEGYKVGDVLRILPCKHFFHKLCIDPWLIEQRSCPICKLDILHAYGIHVSGGKESTSTDTDTQFMFADVTDFLLDVGEPHDLRSVATTTRQSQTTASSSAATRHITVVGADDNNSDENIVVTQPLTTQRMSALRDD